MYQKKVMEINSVLEGRKEGFMDRQGELEKRIK